MKLNNLLLLGLTTALFLSPAEVAYCGSSHTRSHHGEKHGIVGTYTLALGTPSGDTLYGNMSFHKGGTLHGMDSGDIGQIAPPLFPYGAQMTTWTGNWEKVAKRKYKIFLTNVCYKKDGENCCPSYPFGRLKVEGELELSKNGQHLTGLLTGSFWDLNDLSLNTVNIVPEIPLPLSGVRVPVAS